MTDLLKLKLEKTGNIIGKGWHEYKSDMPEIDHVLVKSSGSDYPLALDIMIMHEPFDEKATVCTAHITEMGLNKINMIKVIREHTSWGLKESKDFVEHLPKKLTPADGVSREMLKSLVSAVNNAGGKAEMIIGLHCDNCELRFRCFTER